MLSDRMSKYKGPKDRARDRWCKHPQMSQSEKTLKGGYIGDDIGDCYRGYGILGV